MSTPQDPWHVLIEETTGRANGATSAWNFRVSTVFHLDGALHQPGSPPNPVRSGVTPLRHRPVTGIAGHGLVTVQVRDVTGGERLR
ncbi:hypothetical protein BJP25_03885 [Actinokineospora bangkokensis]|uniref:Uncharacterized protein n=1 Tax=Actinokineospora bangkokensis TaxID=1193682 RepID=A0A1Q9LDN2_9PSEU|nr:hypothetical protein BJP25_03885 [Actinokineospora bangkokensis]